MSKRDEREGSLSSQKEYGMIQGARDARALKKDDGRCASRACWSGKGGWYVCKGDARILSTELP